MVPRSALLLALIAVWPGLAGAFLSARPSGSASEGQDRQPETYEVLSLHETRLSVTIRHGIAACRLVQVFRNNTAGVLEGTYRLPLPEGAEVNGFAVWDEGTKLVGELLPRPRATAVYQAEKERLVERLVREERPRDPGLLTREASERTCSIRVFPILPHADKWIEVSYSLVLPVREGRVRFQFPLALARSFERVGRTSVEVDLADPLGVADPRVSSGGTLERGAAGQTLARLESTGRPKGDFEVSWASAGKGLAWSVAAHRRAGEAEGCFVLRIVPERSWMAAAERQAAMDWVIVTDGSRSMIADKRRLAEEAARQVAAAARPADRVRQVGWWYPSLARVLGEALVLARPERRGRLVLVSDGVTRDEPEDLTALVAERLPASWRLDTVGLGYDDDTAVLEALARAGRGSHVVAGQGAALAGMTAQDLRPWLRAEAHRPYGRFGVPVGDLFPRAFLRDGVTPALGQLALAVRKGPAVLCDLYPDWQAGLAPGEGALLFGRYRGAGRVEATLSGRLGGEPFTRAIALELPAAEPANRMVAAFWGRRRVAEIERAAAGNPTAAQRDEIVRLSLEHRLVTSQTAFLALTDEMRARNKLGAAPKDDVADFYTFSEGVPEPGLLLLAAVALAMVWAARRRRGGVAHVA